MRPQLDDIRTNPYYHFARKNRFVDQKLFLGPKMAIFRIFQIWRPISQRGLPGAVLLKLQSCQALDVASTEVLVRFLALIVSEKFYVFCAFFGFSGSVSADFRNFF